MAYITGKMETDELIKKDVADNFRLAEEIVEIARETVRKDKYLPDSIIYGKEGEMRVQTLLLGYICAKQTKHKAEEAARK